MSSGLVIVVTGSEDPMWPFLLQACSEEEKGKLLLLATDLPDQSGLHYGFCSDSFREGLRLRISNRIVSSEEVIGVWWRREILPELTHFNPELRNYCHGEYRAFLEDLEHMLPLSRWVSLPSALRRAKSKVLQLSLASELGFRILPTLFTNDPGFALDFVQTGKSVYKSIESPRVPLYPDKHSTVFTTLFLEEHYPLLEGVRSCPGIFQRLCMKAADIRVTVFHNSVFSVRIESQLAESSKIDFRIGAKHLKHTVHDLPENMSRMCLDLTHRLGLEFGAIDLALMEDGSYIFFEINPNGQWGWLEDQTGLAMRRSLLDYLFAYYKG